ncbi:MAG: FAD-dependent thymidylate synthase [Candidatus Hydrogenedentota bacterium]
MDVREEDLISGARSIEPRIGSVELLHATPAPYENAVATAMTCYSSRLIKTPEVSKDEKAIARRDRIAERTFKAGHNTTLQHNTFQFAFHGVSRYLLWTFLHDHPFYNSEQVSQRYVRVSAEKVFTPPLSERGRERFAAAVSDAAGTYHRLTEILEEPARDAYADVFTGRRLSLQAEGDKSRWHRDIVKKSQEVARYVLPLATMAHLHHTVSGLTIHRYRRLSNTIECGTEMKLLIDSMVKEVVRHDPLFFSQAEDPLPLDETPERRLLSRMFSSGPNAESKTTDWIRAFDKELSGRTSKLLDCSSNAEATLARAVRTVMGAGSDTMSDDEAIRWALDPERNSHLCDSLNLSTHGKLTKTLVHPHFTFARKLSLSADAQDQRHRCVPGSRPLLASHFRPSTPDYIVPTLVTKSAEAEDLYHGFMKRLWITLATMLEEGEPMESVLYLLPNAFPVRFEESGDLLSLRHKWAMRLCYNAQEEIWRASCDEVEQVRAIFPRIGRWMLPPCGLRLAAGVKPFCPEGASYCGVRVWTMDLADYRRVI